MTEKIPPIVKCPCPTCGGITSRLLHTQIFERLTGIKLFDGYNAAVCQDCGGKFADNIPPLATFDSYYGDQVRRVLSEPGPLVCEVRVVPDEIRTPRLSTVQRPDGSLVSKPLEDLWPFLDREEFRENMMVATLEE